MELTTRWDEDGQCRIQLDNGSFLDFGTDWRLAEITQMITKIVDAFESDVSSKQHAHIDNGGISINYNAETKQMTMEFSCCENSSVNYHTIRDRIYVTSEFVKLRDYLKQKLNVLREQEMDKKRRLEDEEKLRKLEDIAAKQLKREKELKTFKSYPFLEVNWMKEINISLKLDKVSEEKKQIIGSIKGIRIIGDISPIEESVAVRATGQAISTLLCEYSFIQSVEVSQTINVE